MNIRIKYSNLDISAEEFEIIKSDLEKLLKVEPSQKIKSSSISMNMPIDQKDIVVLRGNPASYRVEFCHNEKDREKKKCYLGSLEYTSPVDINKYNK